MQLCPNHEKQIPMIQTYAFMGAELWCPCCGMTTGFPFGSYESVKNTPELIEKRSKFKELTKDYLHAVGVSCCSRTTWKGEMILPSDLPQEEKDRLERVRKEFQNLEEGE